MIAERGVGPTVTLVANSNFLPALQLREYPGPTETRPRDPTGRPPLASTPSVPPSPTGLRDPRRDPAGGSRRLPQGHHLPPHRRGTRSDLPRRPVRRAVPHLRPARRLARTARPGLGPPIRRGPLRPPGRRRR